MLVFVCFSVFSGLYQGTAGMVESPTHPQILLCDIQINKQREKYTHSEPCV